MPIVDIAERLGLRTAGAAYEAGGKVIILDGGRLGVVVDRLVMLLDATAFAAVTA